MSAILATYAARRKNGSSRSGYGVRFIFGYDASQPFVDRAENLHPGDYEELVRKANLQFAGRRTKPPRVKEELVRERGYLNKRLLSEDTAEFGQLTVGTDFRYFFYVTNDRSLSQAEVVAEANGRCNQENIIEQLKNGVRALHAPLNTLDANWAYMVIASLAWTLKAWFALLLPISPRQREQHQADRLRVLRMDFRSFLQRFILIPAQVLFQSRRLIIRLLAWRPELPILFRLLDSW